MWREFINILTDRLINEALLGLKDSPAETFKKLGGKKMDGHIKGYQRIENEFERAGLNLVCFEIYNHDYFQHYLLDFPAEKQFSVSIRVQPSTRKQRNRMINFLLFLNGKGYRRALARRLTACGCGIIKPQNIYVVKPEWA
jgi:hypothetical protein